MMFGSRYLRLIILVAVMVAGSSRAQAESIEGYVKIKGSGLKSKTIVSDKDATSNVVLCASVIEQKIRHLTDLVIQVHGDWRQSPTRDRDCFDADDFEPLRSDAGRTLVCGMLHYRPGVFVVTGRDGAEMLLSEIPDGLRSLLGTKVILDVKSIASPNAAESVKVVVTYRPMP